jgi:CheY-like chemotaxis protein
MEATARINTPAQHPPKILVVDDSMVIRARLTYMMEEAGFEVTTASSAAEALATACADHALIILDVMLPDGTGFEVRRLLRQRLDTRHIPVMLLTALASPSADFAVPLPSVGENTTSAADADAYLAKGTPDDLVLAAVMALMRRTCN